MRLWNARSAQAEGGMMPVDLASLAVEIKVAEKALQQEAFEAARLAQEQEQPVLSFCRRLIAVIRVVLDEKKDTLPSEGWQVIVIALIANVIATVRAASTLGAAGHAREMGLLVRSALESFITAAFIAKTDSDVRARRWADHATILKAKLLKKEPQLSTSAEHVKVRDQIIAKARDLEKDFPKPIFWASGLSKGSVRDLAVDVGMEWYHDFVYWSESQSTHGSAIAVESYVGLTADGELIYKLDLPLDHLRAELAVCCDLLVRALELLNEVLKLDLDKLKTELVAECKGAFGDDLMEPEPQ